MQRFAQLLRRELLASGNQVRLIRPPVLVNFPTSPLRRASKWLGYIDKFLLFPIRLYKAARWADVVHICDHSNSPYIHVLRKEPHLITCNDVLAIRSALGEIPDNPTRRSGIILQKIILGGLNRARRVVCISNNTRQELLRISHVDPAQVSVVYMGINFPYRQVEGAEAWSLIAKAAGGRFEPQPFVFHVGGNQWYKNRLGVLRIYAQLWNLMGETAPRLVMAGHALDDSMREFIAQNGLQEAVIEVQGCSNEALQAFYSMAEVMLFPSLAEGFGWPVIEAQACGCRVVTSDFAPLTEIGGEAAIYCDPRDEAAVARAVHLLLGEDPLARQNRREQGLLNAQRFSAQQMTRDYIAAYREVLGLVPEPRPV
jgi:glycosyltransferase involved in cell wall biosynthesis